jgi:hypothetical protein
MEDYRDHVEGFFKFYSAFDFSEVISTYRGFSVPTGLYREYYPDFQLKGFMIAGPLNRGKNCGAVKSSIKENFIYLCRASYYFIDRLIDKN